MVCPKCGTIVNDEALFCEKCGKKFSAKKHSNKRIVIIAVVTVIVLIVTSVILIINLPKIQLKSALSKDDYYKVVKIYASHYRSDDFREDFNELVEIKVQELYDGCADGCYSCDYVINNFIVLNEVYSVNNEIDWLYKIKESKKAYQAALSYEQSEDYENALKQYVLVIEKDTENYDTAKIKIEECSENIYCAAIKLVDEGSYYIAHDLFLKIPSYKDSEKYINQINEYIILESNALKAIKTSLSKAYQYVKQLPENYYPDSDYIKLCRQYSPYCGKLVWEQGVSPIFNSDFYIDSKDQKLYWSHENGASTSSIFLQTINGYYGEEYINDNMPWEIYVSFFMGDGYILFNHAIDVDNMSSVTTYEDSGKAFITFCDNTVVLHMNEDYVFRVVE